PQCDSKGNLYFRTGRSRRKALILKIASKDGVPTAYQVSGQPVEAFFVAFHVTGGRIAMLMGGKNSEPFVYEFSEDDPGNVSTTALEAPEGLNALNVQSFVVLQNDHFVVQGYFGEGTPADKIGHSYLAEFASSGKLLRLTLNKASNDVIKGVAQRGAKTQAAQGQDRMTYLLLADRIVVLSQGSVDREIKLKPPASGYKPDVLYMHERRLVVGFLPAGEPGQNLKPLFQLLDPSTGEVLRTFESGPEVGSGLVCFSDEGLTFMKMENKELKLINAPIK
ncbi:MAG TPA: hypothetical protein VGJ51_12080, partial [Candidatus Angelobacter sp.]